MKKILAIGIGVILISAGCSIKKKTGSGQVINQLELLKVMPDSDNDGISDELEKKMGTNPFIADIPKISIGLVSDISIGAIFKPQMESLVENKFSMLTQEFYEIDSTKGGDLETLKVLRKKIVKNQYNHLRNIKADKLDIITNDDLRSNILSSWSDDQYYPFMDTLPGQDKIFENDSGKFIANLKIKITNATNVTEISNISLKSFFYDYENMSESEIYNHYLLKSSGSKEKFKLSGNESFSPVTIYPLIANELKSNEVYSKIIDRSEIGVKFTDYSYVSSEVALNYAEVLTKVFDGNAKVIYSDGIKTEVFFVNPTLSIGDALRQVGKVVVLNKDGDIYSINGIETIAKYPIDIDNLRIDDLKKGIWSVFGDGDNFAEQMKPQGQYVVAYSTTKDILNVSKKWSTLEATQNLNSIALDNVYEGDEIQFDISSITVTTITETLAQNHFELGNCSFAPSRSPGHQGNCRMCDKTVASVRTIEVPVLDSLAKMDKWFSFEDSDGEKINVRFFKYGRKIKIIFNSLPSHLKNKIKITFKNPTNKTSSSRNGTVSSTCGDRPSYTNQTFNNIYKINGSVKIFGINKY